MTQFMTSIKDICEVINDSLIIIELFFILQIGPNNLGNIFFSLIIFITICLLFIIDLLI